MPATFEEFWPYYVSQHQNRTSRRLHFAGTTLAMGCLAVAPWAPAALLAAPVCGYGFAWVGHFLVEGNRPATFGHPLWSLYSDFRMLALWGAGCLQSELEKANRP